MPIQNGKYVNPGWLDNGPPAIDAAEMNAISETLENLDAKGGGTTYTGGDGISVVGTEISAKLSTQPDNTATFGKDGGIYVPKTSGGGGSGKRYAVFVVGTSTAGWTAEDCDYLCDGVDDDVEIKAALAAMPYSGGELIILPGTYNISSTINMSGTSTNHAGIIHGAGPDNGACVVFKWTGNYVTDDEPPTESSSSESDCILNITNSIVENISFNMGDGSQAGGNIGLRVRTGGTARNCSFNECPTSILCTGIGAKVDNCNITCYTGKYGCYIAQGTVFGCYFYSGSKIAIASNSKSVSSSVIIIGNTIDASSGSDGILIQNFGDVVIVSENILLNCSITDSTSHGNPVIANNIET